MVKKKKNSILFMAAADMLTFIMQEKGRCMIVGKEGS